MTTGRSSILRRAFSMLSARWVAMQMALALLVFILFVVWLRLPDSSAFSIVLTLLVGACLLLLAGGGEAYLLLRLSGQPFLRRRTPVGGVAILCGIALAIGWNVLMDHVAENDSLWAGYLNSRFPHGLRNVFSYSHIYDGFTWLWTLLSWLGCGVLAAVVVAIITTDQPARAARSILSSITYWASTVVCLFLLSTLFEHISNWTPGHGLVVEGLSLLVRMLVLVLLEGVIASFLLAVVVAAAQRPSALDGTPPESQPRTVAAP